LPPRARIISVLKWYAAAVLRSGVRLLAGFTESRQPEVDPQAVTVARSTARKNTIACKAFCVITSSPFIIS
jgi:hypothetical protein